MHKVNLCKNANVQKLVKEYLMGIFICRSGGSVLYSYQVDPNLNVDLISQFVAALNLFGTEKVGKIKRIIIEGINVEMSIVSEYNLIITIFFRPAMVKDYLKIESEKALKMFYKQYKPLLEQNRTNQMLYSKFDESMCVLIHDYLIRVGVLDEWDVCEHRDEYFDI
mgnify:CR=1 FL=1